MSDNLHKWMDIEPLPDVFNVAVEYRVSLQSQLYAPSTSQRPNISSASPASPPPKQLMDALGRGTALAQTVDSREREKNAAQAAQLLFGASKALWQMRHPRLAEQSAVSLIQLLVPLHDSQTVVPGLSALQVRETLFNVLVAHARMHAPMVLDPALALRQYTRALSVKFKSIDMQAKLKHALDASTLLPLCCDSAASVSAAVLRKLVLYASEVSRYCRMVAESDSVLCSVDTRNSAARLAIVTASLVYAALDRLDALDILDRLESQKKLEDGASESTTAGQSLDSYWPQRKTCVRYCARLLKSRPNEAKWLYDSCRFFRTVRGVENRPNEAQETCMELLLEALVIAIETGDRLWVKDIQTELTFYQHNLMAVFGVKLAECVWLQNNDWVRYESSMSWREACVWMANQEKDGRSASQKAIPGFNLQSEEYNMEAAISLCIAWLS
ncbi:hypothetical protein BJ741DRAFT_607541 [Chytriomyces cf. hyalinus JEL632]|nr:hypothetical protein BJ741DRAFT_607541 [Chytriomyces cf. hyalinus JEL632]